MEENEKRPRREDGRQRRPRRIINKEGQQAGSYRANRDSNEKNAYHAGGNPRRTFNRSNQSDSQDHHNSYYHDEHDDSRGYNRQNNRSYGNKGPVKHYMPRAEGEGDDAGNMPRPRRQGHPEGRSNANATKNYPYRTKTKKEGVIPETARPNPANIGLTRLNKYLSNAGICSRREADNLIAAGAISVNGEIITKMGFMVKPTDEVAYGGQVLKGEHKRYFLLNKPKGYITTLDDPEQRKTVMDLIKDACKERIYPVGRLDRNTTGLLVFTNDGDLSRKLTHPSTGVYKIYHVEVNKPFLAADMKQIREGMELEDGPIKVDDVQYAGDGSDKCVLGVALHSGRNRIVRRIFESLGYEVYKLDRVVFAGLTKKDLPRGRYRELTEKEVAFLKMI